MTKLKSIKLQNYCGYRDTTFDFTDGKGNVKPLILIYGVNGCGKSSALNAIKLVCNASKYENRETDLLFKKMVYNPNYDQYTAYRQEKGLERTYEMTITAIFTTDNGDKKVIIGSNGVKLNELEHDFDGYCYHIDADMANNLSRFQVIQGKLSEDFIEMAKIIYGFDCYFDVGKNQEKLVQDGDYTFYTDFVIIKHKNKVHFKNMSAGEKKLAKILESLCDDYYMEKLDIVIVDSIEKEVFYKRHAPLVDKMVQSFPNKQFVIVTHSGTLIEHATKTYTGSTYDLGEYQKKEWEALDNGTIGD